MKKLVTIVAACMLFVGCEKEENFTSSNVNNTSKPMFTNIPGNELDNNGFRIVTILRGDKRGEWPQHYCVGTKGSCWLWLQRPTNPQPDVNALLKKLDDYLLLYVDYSSLSNEDMYYWQEDANSGIFQLNSDVILEDSTFFTTPVVIPQGMYTISNVKENSYEVMLPYETYIE